MTTGNTSRKPIPSFGFPQFTSMNSDLRLEWDGISRSHAIVAWSTAPAAGAGQLSITCVKVAHCPHLHLETLQFCCYIRHRIPRELHVIVIVLLPVQPCANGVFVNGERVDFALLDIGVCLCYMNCRQYAT